MATIQTLSKEEFAFRLTREFTRKKAEVETDGGIYGLRTMARNLARRSGGDGIGSDEKKIVDTWRRQLQRYMKADHLPRIAIRLLLAQELGCEPEMFGAETDDDPADAASEEDDDPRDLDAYLLDQVRTMRRSLERLERLMTR